MTQEQIEKVNSKANELSKELWNSEHLECFGNLEIKLQEIVEKLTIPVAIESVCHNCGGTEFHKSFEYGDACVNCGFKKQTVL